MLGGLNCFILLELVIILIQTTPLIIIIIKIFSPLLCCYNLFRYVGNHIILHRIDNNYFFFHTILILDGKICSSYKWSEIDVKKFAHFILHEN